MCTSCSSAFLRMRKRGFSRAFVEMFFWHYTPCPAGGGEYVMRPVMEFLSKRTRKAGLKWMRRRERAFDREIAAINEESNRP